MTRYRADDSGVVGSDGDVRLSVGVEPIYDILGDLPPACLAANRIDVNLSPPHLTRVNPSPLQSSLPTP
jgi:hypothetical protein